MEERVRKKQFRKNINYKYFIYIVAIIALLQLLTLRACYQEKIFKLPEKLFSSKIDFPISELTLDITYGEPESRFMEDSNAYMTEEDSAIESDENQSNDIESHNLSDIQRDIVLKALELLDEDIKYGYDVFPDTGYPSSNVWISTDVISVTLRDCGYDLMDLIYEDMNEHKEDYPMDIKGRKTAIKYIDFRDVFFQEQFFKRNALTTLPLEYDKENENNNFLWQAGDIVYFQFDENNPYKDLGGFISPNKNNDGIPLVIMISKELGKVREVDKLLEYKIVGHFRYPPPEVD
ncbi:unnamed protein product [marine sediment metagenome]|uniref:DUF1287 domain-containing protein n=3 Tax=marine sediment metagenome TaxID=412755 RepID=X1DKH6_9ZZZZ